MCLLIRTKIKQLLKKIRLLTQLSKEQARHGAPEHPPTRATIFLEKFPTKCREHNYVPENCPDRKSEAVVLKWYTGKAIR